MQPYWPWSSYWNYFWWINLLITFIFVSILFFREIKFLIVSFSIFNPKTKLLRQLRELQMRNCFLCLIFALPFDFLFFSFLTVFLLDFFFFWFLFVDVFFLFQILSCFVYESFDFIPLFLLLICLFWEIMFEFVSSDGSNSSLTFLIPPWSWWVS